MNRIPAHVSKALLSDAKTASSHIQRWSIRSLAGLLTDGKHDVSGRNGVVPKEVAATLLTDVKLRLAGQHAKCVELRKLLAEPNKDHDKTSNNNATTNDTPNIIRAVNAPVSVDLPTHIRDVQRRQETRKLVENLETLHVDTYRLAHQLAASPVLTRFSAADRSLVASTLEEIQARHASSVETLADVVTGAGRRRRGSDDDGLDDVVHAFLRGRLGVQLSCDQYGALHRRGVAADVVGRHALADVVDAAVTEAAVVCTQNLLVAPDVRTEEGPEKRTLLVVRPWLHHVLVEVLKNAMRASVTDGAVGSVPSPVTLRVADDDDDYLDVRVVDGGAGLPAEGSVARAMRFAETDAGGTRYDRLEEQQSYAIPQTVPLRGLGVGLPLSRMMMRHFGGDLLLEDRSRSSNGNERGCVATIRIRKDTSVQETLS